MNTTTSTSTTDAPATTDTVDSSENVTHTVQLVDQPTLLLVTANIGSIFDSVSATRPSQTTRFLRHVFVYNHQPCHEEECETVNDFRACTHFQRVSFSTSSPELVLLLITLFFSSSFLPWVTTLVYGKPFLL